MPFIFVRQDITTLKVDAIVNPADISLQMGGGVSGAIFSAAGADKLQNACNSLAPIKTGESVITQGFNLSSRYIIHTAIPVYSNDNQGEKAALHSCYKNSLELAVKHNCESIAFPLISRGTYCYSKAEALKVAAAVIQDFLAGHDIFVMLVMIDKEAFIVSDSILGGVDRYIDEHYEEHYVDERELEFGHIKFLELEPEELFYEVAEARSSYAEKSAHIASLEAPAVAGIDDLVENLDEPFSQTLLRLIDAKGKSDVDIYKRANIDRRLFSKIRTDNSYIPSKKTALALAIALELSLDETDDLLERAGYALSHAVKFDVIIEYFIKREHYNIFEINEVLFRYDQPLLGG
jgi:O-acetyl-ADP-ribose deacetylase (regulator of RNase III)